MRSWTTLDGATVPTHRCAMAFDPQTGLVKWLVVRWGILDRVSAK
jgi:hypothetical protein